MKENRINDVLKKINNINYLTNETFSEEIDYIEDMYNDSIFKVVVIGEFSSGKSTFLNALIGKRILYSDMDEATGMTTTIENSENNIAIVYFEDEDVKKIKIDSNSGYDELSKYLNINNQKHKKVKHINVKYKFENIDEEIVFVDTPGLQGISDEQLLVTKNAIKDANAVIMLINKKGLSETELDLICGKNEQFGKLSTKEVFVLINKIGQIYDSNDSIYANQKVDEIVAQVKYDLNNNNVCNARVFAIDALDYLHGKDCSLYERFKLSKKNTSYNVLNQDEYILRSRYEEFKRYLFEFLEADNRKKVFEEDIIEKIGIILDEIEDVVNQSINESGNNSELRLNQYQKEIDMLLENRRKFINILKRQISEISDELIESIFKELKSFESSIVGNKGKIVNNIQQDVNSLTIHNLKLVVDKTINNVNEDISIELKSINKNINLYYSNLNKILSDIFSNEFKKIFSKKCDVNFNFINNDVKLDLKFDKKEFISEYSEEIEITKKQITDKKQDSLLNNKMRIKSEYDVYQKLLKSLDESIKSVENEYYSSKNKLGKRPLPAQKYRTVERTKGILFWKKTYYEDVPDGFDYTECERWDDRTREIQNRLKSEQDRISREKSRADKNKSDAKWKLNKIEILDNEILELEDNIKILEHKAKLSIEKNKDIYIERKKEDIYVWTKKYVRENIKNLSNNIENTVVVRNESIKKMIEKESIKYLDNYQISIEKDLDGIKEVLKDDEVSNEYLFNLINDLRNDLVRMG